jgi:phosphate transport system substrate-binding protein
MKKFLVVTIVFFLLFSFYACKKKLTDGWDDTIDSGIIRIACDENFKNLMDAEIDAFEAHSNYKAIINPIYSNEKEVIRLLTEDSVRFALTTRDLYAPELKILEEKKMHVRKFLIAFDGIALIANKANADSIIGLPVIKKILTGEITEWSQINPHSSLGTIRVIFDNNQSGVLRYVVDSITREKTLSSNLYALNGSDELIDKVGELPNAIGVIGFNLISSETRWKMAGLQDKIRMIWVSTDEKATLKNSYLPYAGDVMPEDYPLWRAVYVLLSDPRSGLSSGFSIFLAHDVGQMVILKSGLLPAVTAPQNRSVNIIDAYPE